MISLSHHSSEIKHGKHVSIETSTKQIAKLDMADQGQV